MKRGGALAALCFILAAEPQAQTIPAARLTILLAEARGAPEARDLATLRTGIRSADGETARVAIRALGRLGRPALVPDIVPALRLALPELRAEAAAAIASAVSGTASTGAKASNVGLALSALCSRLDVEAEPAVRAAILESLGRVPYRELTEVQQAEGALVRFGRSEPVADRLGVAKGFEALVRFNRTRWTLGPESVVLLRELTGLPPVADITTTASRPDGTTIQPRDARVRRLALEALTTANLVDAGVLRQVTSDPDPQVRRLAVHAAAILGSGNSEALTSLRTGLADPQPMVRAEALRGVAASQSSGSQSCQDFIGAVADPVLQVAVTAIELLAQCGGVSDAVDVLDQIASEIPPSFERTAFRAGRALVSLSRAAPDRAAARLTTFALSPMSALRAAAVAAATATNDRAVLEKLAQDVDEGVALAARQALGVVPPRAPRSEAPSSARDFDAAELQRLASARARITVRGVGMIEVALLTSEAPATVLWFARAAESGRFYGVALGRVLANLIALAPGGASASDRAAGPANKGEVSSWPHVRGSFGFLPGDAMSDDRIFVDLADNPPFDHVHPAFAQVLNGMELLDQLLEGDIIERIEIIPGF